MPREPAFRIWLLVYEKFILAVAVALITAAFLYFYNIYGKAFEIAGSQSRSYTLIGEKLRDLVLDNSLKAAQEIRFAYYYPDDAGELQEARRSLPKEKAQAAHSLTLDLEKISTLLVVELPKSAALAKAIATRMRESIVDFESGLTFESPQIDSFETAIGDLQIQFLRTYNSEIAALTITEFRRFKEQFDKEIPFLLQPGSVIIIFLLVFAASTFGIFRISR